jgi:DtxR family Mn-dependent transcriptional regulator
VVEIAALKNTSDEFLKFLNEKGIQLGQVVTVLNIEAYDKSMTVTISSVNQMLTKKAADDLLVKT